MSFDVESSGLLDGLDGEARDERAELVNWLLKQGISAEEIGRSSFTPMLLPARRALGDDGTYVSARQISERTGLELDTLTRFQRAAGLPYVDDPDAAVFMRPDGDTAVHIKAFLDQGIDPDQMLAVVRVLAEGLANAAEVMRAAALGAVIRPGATELQTAQGARAVVGAVAPLIGPMITDLLLLQLRHAAEIEAVNATERALGAPLPGRGWSPRPSPTWWGSPGSVRRFRPSNWRGWPTASPIRPARSRWVRCASSRPSGMR